MRKFFPFIVAVAVAACASEPAQKSAPASPPPVAPPAPSAPVAASTPAAPTAPAAATAKAGVEGFNTPAGYTKKTRGSTTVYCKTETPVGTRFGKEYCYSQQDLERMESNRANAVEQVERARRTCTGGCSGG
jgi:hypothetical protein